ncbi:uncharacterized protein CC84DRAFT_1165175 [Paraphaeosphaeria sporulosa]|uniref:Uncharacterized protein n=1 Tax=Paraphaeosphaeria sporulosa TaxID=1460663 RepID=A0A177CDF3_9PLEO|nr:uncharacterized protein CC84DRAFT_1165175 [Paraphaeosphaeria sporulosa]OAG04798.1 hypothetical protein CC84DRAFT_1165175 [Paraphaeosphaeria sporulosa]
MTGSSRICFQAQRPNYRSRSTHPSRTDLQAFSMNHVSGIAFVAYALSLWHFFWEWHREFWFV